MYQKGKKSISKTATSYNLGKLRCSSGKVSKTVSADLNLSTKTPNVDYFVYVTKLEATTGSVAWGETITIGNFTATHSGIGTTIDIPVNYDTSVFTYIYLTVTLVILD